MENRVKMEDTADKLAKLVPKHRTLTETAALNPLDLIQHFSFLLIIFIIAALSLSFV